MDGYLYAQSGRTAYRFSLSDFVAEAIPNGTALSIGGDRKLYAYLNNISGNGHQVRIYDSSTFQLQDTISLETGDPRRPGLAVTALTINAEGLMTLAVAGQGVFQVDSDGNRVGQVYPYGFPGIPYDIDEFAPNKFAVTSRFGEIYILNDGLNPNAVHSFTLPRAGSGFVGVVTVPETSPIYLLGIIYMGFVLTALCQRTMKSVLADLSGATAQEHASGARAVDFWIPNRKSPASP